MSIELYTRGRHTDRRRPTVVTVYERRRADRRARRITRVAAWRAFWDGPWATAAFIAGLVAVFDVVMIGMCALMNGCYL